MSRIGPHISVSYASNFALLALFNVDAGKFAIIAKVKIHGTTSLENTVESSHFWYVSCAVTEGLVAEVLQPPNSGKFCTAVLQRFRSTLPSPPFTAFQSRALPWHRWPTPPPCRLYFCLRLPWWRIIPS